MGCYWVAENCGLIGPRNPADFSWDYNRCSKETRWTREVQTHLIKLWALWPKRWWRPRSAQHMEWELAGTPHDVLRSGGCQHYLQRDSYVSSGGLQKQDGDNWYFLAVFNLKSTVSLSFIKFMPVFPKFWVNLDNFFLARNETIEA